MGIRIYSEAKGLVERNLFLGEKVKKKFVVPSGPTLSDPMDCSPPGSSLCEILQVRILECVAISFSRGSSDPGIEPRFPALQTGS